MLHGIHTSSAQGRSQKGPGLSAGVPLLLQLAAPPPRTTLTQGRTSALAGSLVHKHPDARVPRCRTNDVALKCSRLVFDAATGLVLSSALKDVLGSTETASVCSLFGRVTRAVGGDILGLVDLLEERILGGEGSLLLSPQLLCRPLLQLQLVLIFGVARFFSGSIGASARLAPFDSGSTGGDALGVNGLPSFLCPYPR